MNARCIPVLLVVWLASAVTCARAAEDPYLDVPSGLTHTLKADGNGRYSVRLGVLPHDKAQKMSELTCRVFEVQFKESRPSDFANRFKASLIPATDSHADALEIVADAGPKQLLPGNYIVVVEVRLKGEAARNLTFTLTKPAPAVTVGAPVHIERGGDAVSPGELLLTEESGVAALTEINVTSALDHKEDVPAPQGTLKLPDFSGGVPAGTAATFAVGLEGEFPPGKYTGKIMVRSQQLSAPLTVNFDIVSRRSTFWLVFIAALGVALGYLLRVALKGKLDVSEASLTASISMQKLLLARQRIAEPETRSQIAALIESLNAVTDGGKAAEINKTAAEVLTTLGTIEAAFKTQRDSVAPQVAEANKLLARNFRLPPEAQQALARATPKLRAVAAAFATNNLSETGTRADEARSALLVAVRAGIEWRKSFADFLEELKGHPGPMSANVQARLNSASQTIRTETDAINDPVAVTFAEADTQLTEAHAALVRAERIVAESCDGHSAFLRAARDKLAEAPVDANDWNAVEAEAANLRAILESAPARPGHEARRNAERQVSLLEQALKTLLLKAAPQAQQEVEDAAAALDWVKAVDAAVPAAAAQAMQANPVVETPATSTMTALEAEDAQPTLEKIAGGTEPFVLTGRLEEQRRLRRRTSMLELWQTAAVGAVFVGGVYLLNADTWIGTYKDMLAIGLLGFGVDLSAQGVATVLKK